MSRIEELTHAQLYRMSEAQRMAALQKSLVRANTHINNILHIFEFITGASASGDPARQEEAELKAMQILAWRSLPGWVSKMLFQKTLEEYSDAGEAREAEWEEMLKKGYTQ